MIFKNNFILIFSVLIGYCIIIFSCNESKNKGEETGHDLPDEVTFSSHIVHIVHSNCTPCHRENGPAPFPLVTFRDVAKRALMIKTVTETRFMPPWPADAEYSNFIEERILSDYQIALIQKWVEDGAPAGNLASLPEPPHFPEGSVLGKPDVVVKYQEFHIKGNNRDNFRMAKVPFEIEKDTFIRVIEFVPGAKKLVHHMNANLVNYKDGAKKNVFQGEFYVDTEMLDNKEHALKLLDLANDDGTLPQLSPMVSNYLPGVLPVIYPDGIGGFRMNKKGAFFINDIHYGPSAVDEVDESYFNIFYADKPPERPTGEFILGTVGISRVIPPLIIPPDTVMAFSTRYTLPHDLSVLTINPHMHLLGKSFLAYAISTKGDTIPLIKIPEWDFRWQYFYTFRKILKLERGTTIYVFGEFDNTADNPNNPFDPPQKVGERDGSMRTTDEMLQLIVTWMPYRQGDENISLENSGMLKNNLK